MLILDGREVSETPAHAGQAHPELIVLRHARRRVVPSGGDQRRPAHHDRAMRELVVSEQPELDVARICDRIGARWGPSTGVQVTYGSPYQIHTRIRVEPPHLFGETAWQA